MAKNLPKNLKKQIEGSSQSEKTKELVKRKYGTLTNSEEYWKNRSEARILAAEKTANEMLKDLKVLYQDTIERINKDIAYFYGKYATDTGLNLSEVNKLLTPDELNQFRREAQKYYENLSKYPYDKTYKDNLKNQIYITTTKEGRKLYSLRKKVSRLEALKMEMQNAIETLYARENEAFTTNMAKTYKDTYMRSMFDTQQAIGVFMPFDKLNNNIVQKAVQEKWLGQNYSDRIWADKNKLVRTLETTFSQDVALGKNPKAIATDIKKVMGTKYSNCVRLARTEFNKIANAASQDSYINAGLEKYIFIATLDSRTSEICAELDNKIFLVKEAEIGVNKAPMHANCRSTDIPYLEDLDYSKMERIAKDETGKIHYVPSSMSYAEWKNSLTDKQGRYFVANQK